MLRVLIPRFFIAGVLISRVFIPGALIPGSQECLSQVFLSQEFLAQAFLSQNFLDSYLKFSLASEPYILTRDVCFRIISKILIPRLLPQVFAFNPRVSSLDSHCVIVIPRCLPRHAYPAILIPGYQSLDSLDYYPHFPISTLFSHILLHGLSSPDSHPRAV